MSFFIQSTLLVLSSVVSFILIYYNVPITSLQQILAGMLLIIIFLDRFIVKPSQPINFTLRIFLLGLISLFLQILIVSTGGFYSPFLVVFHLFAIALSFLINPKIATIFLFSSVSALTLSTFTDQKLLSLLNNDYATLALYLLSFIAIIPLYWILAGKYYFKDALSKILTRELTLTQRRQKTVFEGLSNIVIITDKNLKILSFNEAAQKELKLSSSELIGRPLFDVLIIKDGKDQIVNDQYLSIEHVVKDKTTRTVSDLQLYVRNAMIPKKITIGIRPTTNLEGQIDQIAFIISDAQSAGEAKESHQNLQESMLKHEAAFEDLKNSPLSKGELDLYKKAELFGNVERDILTAMELQDHQLRPVTGLKDVAQILPRIISAETVFAKTLEVDLLFTIDNKYLAEALKLIPQGSTFSPSVITSPFFTAPIDSKWFDLLLQKLLEIALLLVCETAFPKVEVFLTYDLESVYITIGVNTMVKIEDDGRLIFTEYYGELGNTTNLRLGSGLEGYMAKTIALSLGIPLQIKINNQPPNIVFTLQLSKKPPGLPRE